jgi:two-component system sensor histidine kinase QseC
MTLQRRLLLLLLIGAPAIWVIAVGFSGWRARIEINELFDTQQIRLAQQVLALLPAAEPAEPRRLALPAGDAGGADLADMSVAVWNAAGERVIEDREGAALPAAAGREGFHEAMLGGERWRVFYLRSPQGIVVAVGQATEERDEVLRDLLLSQLLPWFLMLPVLIAVLVAGVHRALRPVHLVSQQLEARHADDLQPVTADVPSELQPLIRAINGLFERIARAVEHERRLTADAAHELRTPLAALRAQWEAADAAQRRGDTPAVEHARAQVGRGIERIEHLFEQLLSLARAEGDSLTAAAPVDWERVLEQALSVCLPTIERRGAEVVVEWPANGLVALPLRGDEALLATLLRNLIDNALRYGGKHVHLRMAPDHIVVEDDGPGVAADLLGRLGDRFHRPPGQAQDGSGLGLSIVERIAGLHGLAVRYANRTDRSGLRVELARASGAAPTRARRAA